MIIRHDDYDFRLSTQQYIDIHEEFKKLGLENLFPSKEKIK